MTMGTNADSDMKHAEVLWPVCKACSDVDSSNFYWVTNLRLHHMPAMMTPIVVRMNTNFRTGMWRKSDDLIHQNEVTSNYLYEVVSTAARGQFQ